VRSTRKPALTGAGDLAGRSPGHHQPHCASALRGEIAMPMLKRLMQPHKCHGVLPLSAGLGTVKIGKPRDTE
jgi:hypothetical protein